MGSLKQEGVVRRVPLLGDPTGRSSCGNEPSRPRRGHLVSVFGPRGRIRIAFAVLVIAVGSLAAVVAQDRQAAPAEVRINAAQNDHWLDQPESECSEGVVVFAKNFGAGGSNYQSAYLDLTQGVYVLDIYASARRLTWDQWSFVEVRGWNAQGDQVSNSSRDTKSWRIGFYGDQPVNSDGWAAGKASLPLPGGTALVTLKLSQTVMQQASQWRWEIVAPGVCGWPADEMTISTERTQS